MKLYIKFLIPVLALCASCEPELENSITEDDIYTTGSLDVSTFVSVGNSLTAGYADGALYLSGQQNSFPNIMAGQFALAGGGAFNQPLTEDNYGGLLLDGMQIELPRLALINGAPIRIDRQPSTEISVVGEGPFNNMGVPGAKSFHLGLSGYGNASGILTGTANPYYARMASAPDATIIGDAIAQEPTFFSLWIGNNDILSFATSGGTGIDQTGNPDPSSYGSNDITDPQVFASVYSSYVNALTQATPDGILVNIPDVTSIPYFTTVPFAALSPQNSTFGPQIPTLNATFAPLNQAFAFLGVPERSITFNTDAASAVVIYDDSLPNIAAQLTQVLVGGGLDVPTATLYGQQFGQVRQATAEDLLVLTSSSVIGTVNQERLEQLIAAGLPEQAAAQLAVNGITYPLEDLYTLTQNEQEMITTAQNAYNATIETLASENDLILIDAQEALRQVAETGVTFDAGVLQSTFGTGGAFSLDGVHPTARGYAYLSNLMINAINRKYEANIPVVNLGDFQTITVTTGAQ